MASTIQLSEGCVIDLFNDRPPADNPVVQVLGIKKLENTQGDRYRVVISDGQFYQQAMLATQMNEKVHEGGLERYGFIRIVDSITNTVQGRRIVIILNLDIVAKPSGEMVGNPQNVEKADLSSLSSAPAPQTTAPAAQPAQAAPTNMAGSGPIAKEQFGVAGGASHPLSALNPYINGWTVKVRVMNKNNIRTWANQRGEGKLFSFDVCDETGEMRVTTFNNGVDRFFDVIEKDKVYLISGGNLKGADRRFSSLKSEYEMTIDERSKVEPCIDDCGIPHVTYNFSPLANLESVEANASVDVIGVIQNVADFTEFTAKSGNRFEKRTVTIYDQSKRAVDLTLWGEQAREFNATPNQILAIKGCRVSDFNGRSLNASRGANITLEPDINEAHQLKGWHQEELKKNDGNVQTTSMSTAGGPGGGAMRRTDEKTLSQVHEENMGANGQPEYFSARCFLSLLPHERPIYYEAEPGGNKKVVKNNGVYVDDKTGAKYDRCDYRYLLNFQMQDYSGTQWVSAFNDIGPVLLNGTSAAEVAQWTENGQNQQLSNLVADNLFKQLVCKFRVKQEEHRETGAMRPKVVAVAAQNVDYVQESTRLLDALER